MNKVMTTRHLSIGRTADCSSSAGNEAKSTLFRRLRSASLRKEPHPDLRGRAFEPFNSGTRDQTNRQILRRGAITGSREGVVG